MPDETKSIQFLTAEPDYTPAPTPAAQHVAEWLKKMPAEAMMAQGHGGEEVGLNGTVKKCMPFLDAMTCGYVVPIAADVQFYMVDALNLDIVSPERLVGWQNQQGYPGAPFEKRLVVKFINRWVIQTPPGYSTLFLPLLNQVRIPFQILAGLVDTDTYYNEVYFPAICQLSPGEYFHLQRGTPIVQAIPVPRDLWKSSIAPVDATRLAETKATLKANHHMYQEANWEKKTYR